ncbi:MAG: hypothetical protein DKINENOH_00082 [bacterium]|nr:hypothetical protein [bacterium]
MKKQCMVFLIWLMVLTSIRQNSRAQEIMCPMGASGGTILPLPPSFHVGVILVQFSDWATNEDARGGVCKIHLPPNNINHYTYQAYYDHFFSTGFRTDPYGKRTHDEEDVFGSMKEYFEEMSYGTFTITGDIINPHPDPNATPAFATLTQTKAWWISNGGGPQALLNAALAVSGYSTAGYDKIAVIYAGQEVGGGLQPSALIGGDVFQSSEKNSGPRGRTQTTGTFYGIGTHAHEFAHNLGLDDLQLDHAPWRGGVREFDLMATGNQGFMDGNPFNSAIGGWHAPTPLSGYSKLSWAGPLTLTSQPIKPSTFRRLTKQPIFTFALSTMPIIAIGMKENNSSSKTGARPLPAAHARLTAT